MALVTSLPGSLSLAFRRGDWEYGTEVHRASPFIEQLGPALGLDAAAIDAAFRKAAGI